MEKKQRGRPKKNPGEKVDYKYIAVHRKAYEKILTESTDKNMTLVDFINLLLGVK